MTQVPGDRVRPRVQPMPGQIRARRRLAQAVGSGLIGCFALGPVTFQQLIDPRPGDPVGRGHLRGPALLGNNSGDDQPGFVTSRERRGTGPLTPPPHRQHSPRLSGMSCGWTLHLPLTCHTWGEGPCASENTVRGGRLWVRPRPAPSSRIRVSMDHAGTDLHERPARGAFSTRRRTACSRLAI